MTPNDHFRLIIQAIQRRNIMVHQGSAIRIMPENLLQTTTRARSSSDLSNLQIEVFKEPEPFVQQHYISSTTSGFYEYDPEPTDEFEPIDDCEPIDDPNLVYDFIPSERFHQYHLDVA